MIADCGSPEMSALFRLGMRRHASTVCAITTVYAGERYGMAATAMTSVSTEPPTLLVCINRNASLHAPLRASGRFAVTLLSADDVDLARRFGGAGPRDERFGDERWRERDGWAFLDKARATFLVTTESMSEHNTHSVVIGQVRDVLLGNEDTPALIYHDGRYAASALTET